MIVNTFAGLARVALVALVGCVLILPARAQTPAPPPSPAAVALAKELIETKGGGLIFQPIVPGVIEQVKNTFLQTNPGLVKELTEVATQLRTEFAGKRDEILNGVAQLYAQRFTEQELREAVAFYKTPLGQKIVNEEPKILDESFGNIQQWAGKFSEEVVTKMRAEMKKKGHDL
jgi:hypothetical protein